MGEYIVDIALQRSTVSEILPLILDELAPASLEISKGVKNLFGEKIFKIAEAAEICLVSAKTLPAEQKLAIVAKAKDLFLQCHAELIATRSLNKYSGKVAFQIAVCFGLLQDDVNLKKWLIASITNFRAFANVKVEMEKEANSKKNNWIGGKLLAVISGIAAVIFAPISLPVAGGVFLVVEGISLVSNKKADQLKEIEAKAKLEQNEAFGLSQEVAQVIAKLNAAKN